MKRVGWVLLGPRTVASARLQGYLIIDWMNARPGWRADILHRPPAHYSSEISRRRLLDAILRLIWLRPHLVVFQKVAGRNAKLLMALARRLGSRVVFVDCDKRDGYDFAPQVDVFVCPSQGMARDIAQQTGRDPVVIEDPAEFGISWSRSATPEEHRPFRGVWVGSTFNFEEFRTFMQEVEQQSGPVAQIDTISNHPEATRWWRLEDFPKIFEDYAFSVLPLPDRDYNAIKSSNRVVMCMAAGIPVVAQDHPAYRSVIRHDENGLLFGDAAEFRDNIDRLRNPALRTRLSRQALDDISRSHTLDIIGWQWLDLFERTLAVPGDTAKAASEAKA